MTRPNNVVTWFEIPCADLERAARFYEQMTGAPLQRAVFMGVPHALFASSADVATGGALVLDPQNAPSRSGTLVYLDARGELDAWLARVELAGGSIAQPATSIGEMGMVAIVVDSEGNRVGLHTA